MSKRERIATYFVLAAITKKEMVEVEFNLNISWNLNLYNKNISGKIMDHNIYYIAMLPEIYILIRFNTFWILLLSHEKNLSRMNMPFGKHTYL